MNGQSSALHFDFNIRDNEVLLSILNLNQQKNWPSYPGFRTTVKFYQCNIAAYDATQVFGYKASKCGEKYDIVDSATLVIVCFISHQFSSFFCDVSIPYIRVLSTVARQQDDRTDNNKKINRLIMLYWQERQTVPDGIDLEIFTDNNTFAPRMESYIHSFETPSGSGTPKAQASMPECLPPEVSRYFRLGTSLISSV